MPGDLTCMDYHYEVSNGNNLCKTLVTCYSVIILCPLVPCVHVLVYWFIIVVTILSLQTQPVPNPLSYFLHQSPAFVHKLKTLGNHFVELVVSYMCMCRGGNACVCIKGSTMYVYCK